MKLQWNAGMPVRIVTGFVVLILVFWAGTRLGGGKSGTTSEPAAHEHGSTEKVAQIWTCSMHPQIRMSKPGKCPICGMDLIPLSRLKSNDDTSHAGRLTMSESARKIAGIATVPAVRRGLTADIRLTGKIALDETRVEMITARVGGRIDRLYVDYTGVPVVAGDHLAEMYSPELVSLQKELLEASKALSGAGQQAGETVRSGLSRTFDAAKEKLRLLGFSDGDMDAVLRRGTVSDHMTIRAGQNGIVLRKLVEEGSYVQTGTPLFHIADLRKLWLMLDAYESDLMWLRLGQTVEFSVEAWPGETFQGAVSFIDPVVDPMTRTVNVRVIVDNGSGRLKPDMFVKARVQASLSKSGAVKNSALRGKWICPMHPQVVKNKAGTCDICGMPLVKAEELGYVTSGFEDVNPLVIPATAPLYTGERSLVYVAVPNAAEPTYEARTVELGPRVGAYYIVRSGISEGEQVVVNGSFKIDAELQIQAKPSMMDPADESKAGKNDHAAMQEMNGTALVVAPEQIPDIGNAGVSGSFLADLGRLETLYFDVAHALATDNADTAKAGLVALRERAATTASPKGAQYAAWESVRKALAKDLEHAHHAEGLSDVRVLFDKVSRQMIMLEKQYGHASDSARYLAFCPMAFDRKGAYWLQTRKKISNPYFGSKMPGCGEIKETFGQKTKVTK